MENCARILRGEPHLFACHYLSQGRKREIAKRVIHVRFGEASRRSAIAAERNEAEEHNRRLLVHFPISCRDKLAIVKVVGGGSLLDCNSMVDCRRYRWR